ncbi:glycosyltransferase family 8 protein [Methylobacterium nodulans]|uniref:Glycosyl transferase family 8 n=1 Tax=Methylobacterium nodulans (strain LMG 21967 / CNCM I-2342 / ORS 2060) TaxID=460265 RepID=B8ISQ5_METNO|nr:glycosyltransferase family 8 protein [Methylobacterium nodulans]ACL60704.1 glycosyl transferase family 8 [Methylobacterium nodulans ORS 2060]
MNALHETDEIDRIAVALCIDRAFFRHALVTVASLLDAGPRQPLDVHIFYAEADPACMARIAALFADQDRHGCHFQKISLDRFEGFPVSDAISAGTYARLLLPYLMPRRAKVLYLDADLIVLDDVAPLWRTELGAAPVAAVRDPFCDNRPAIGFSPDEPYFNAGVLLMNLAVWRREGLAERVAAHIDAHGASLKYFDQDALNVVLRGRARFVDPRWNFQPRMADATPADIACARAEFRRTRARPAIIHYTTPHKPWKDPFAIHYGRHYLDCLMRLEPDLRARYFADVPQQPRLRASHLKARMRWRFPEAYRAARTLFRAVRGGARPQAS